jgi:hypothetical protein
MRAAYALIVDLFASTHAICFAGERWRVMRADHGLNGATTFFHLFCRSCSNVRKVCSPPHYSSCGDLARRQFRFLMKSKPSG